LINTCDVSTFFILARKFTAMNYDRRKFIRTSAFALGSLGLTGISCTGNNKRMFRYALCSETVKEYSWAEQCSIIGQAGFAGVEIAPFTLVKEGVGEIPSEARKQMVRSMKDAGIVCAGLHWLFVPPPQGLHFTTPDEVLRQKSVGYLLELIDFCSDMGGEVMIFGSPAQRSTTGGISVSEAVKHYTEGLEKVADHAKERNVRILIEPLPKSSTDVINTTAEAMNIVRQLNHPAISTMFDYHNSTDETEPLTDIIKNNIKHIHHIHVQNMDGTLIRTDNIPPEIISIMKTLKDLNYKEWVSIEVFDFTPGGKVIASEGMRTFLEIEKMIKEAVS
jgi:D-psicose/D-tagatose/L-ribulose 3-epimerase